MILEHAESKRRRWVVAIQLRINVVAAQISPVDLRYSGEELLPVPWLRYMAAGNPINGGPPTVVALYTSRLQKLKMNNSLKIQSQLDICEKPAATHEVGCHKDFPVSDHRDQDSSWPATQSSRWQRDVTPLELIETVLQELWYLVEVDQTDGANLR